MFDELVSWKEFQPDVARTGGWTTHTPFAYDLARSFKPDCLVELGTFKGESFFAFCQAVKRHKLKSQCYAIDTWQGDSHGGRYEDSVYENVKSLAEAKYSSIATLIRKQFAEASPEFENDSIDLLHIDGLHTYEAVSEDFNTWFPKVKDGGVILFHDTTERRDDFGVWRFWEELLAANHGPTFNFDYGHGLGVLIKNKPNADCPGWLKKLVSGSPDLSSEVYAYFKTLGELLYFKQDSLVLREECDSLFKRLCAANEEIAHLHQRVERLRMFESVVDLARKSPVYKALKQLR